MATIVGIDCLDGALLAGDRLVVERGQIVGERPHVFEFGDVGVAAVGGHPDTFRRRFEGELRDYALARGEPGIEAVSHMAAAVAEDTGVEAIVVARDETGTACVRSVDDGVLDERLAARGSAAPAVLGQLEAIGEVDLAIAASHARAAFRAAAARDPETGAALDVWRLADAG